MELVEDVFCLDSLEFLADELAQKPVAPALVKVRFWPRADPKFTQYLVI